MITTERIDDFPCCWLRCSGWACRRVGLIENNPKKGIANPTTERLLKAFDDVTLTIVRLPGQIIRHVTPLSALQTRILELLGLSPGVYVKLSAN